MKRAKRHRIKHELPETSTSRPTTQKDHDLAYYIHDRVELMHQVFSVLKPKELKAMAPQCVRHISINDLQELCMEELLGISSKRLCAILDGASPPSDTESSSESEQLETISLDSISSDDEILSQVSTKKSKKHKHRSKAKKRKSKNKDNEGQDQADRSRRAGLTVLELLELQARARAIRAQLQQEQASAASTDRPSESVTGNSSDDEVEIKEEAAEVVEISSEDEKPDLQELEERLTRVTRKDTAPESTYNSKTVTKKVNDLIITVPKANTSRKIKLKRNSNIKPVDKTSELDKEAKDTNKVVTVKESTIENAKKQESETIPQISTKPAVDAETPQSKVEKPKTDVKDKNKQTDKAKTDTKDKSNKDKKKKRKRDKLKEKDGSDHDEITLQLSDSEKMDLLEDLDGQKSGKCSDTEDSSSDSSDEDSLKQNNESERPEVNESTNNNNVLNLDSSKQTESDIENVSDDKQTDEVESVKKTPSDLETLNDDEQMNDKTVASNDNADKQDLTAADNVISNDINTESQSKDLKDDNVIIQSSKENVDKMSCLETTPLDALEDATNSVKETVQDAEMTSNQTNNKQSIEFKNNNEIDANVEEIRDNNKVLEAISNTVLLCNSESITDNASIEIHKNTCKQKSDGELSDRDSSEVEASDFKPDVVCISDDDDSKGKKKKKKDKKNKKDKKSKKKKDFRESSDQNFYRETCVSVESKELDVILISDAKDISELSTGLNSSIVNTESQSKELSTNSFTDHLKVITKGAESFTSSTLNTEDVYEILELSDDSSCYELEEISISKEPTAEEIEALSAKFDEIERNRDIEKEGEKGTELNESWKDRYLNSSKVKRVLTTANIMNAMKKKNLELKKKLEANKKKTIEDNLENAKIKQENFEDGSIEQYKTLEALTKYVDPIKEVNESSENQEKDKVTNEMKKEAKQLLKMYKMLLKYNDISLKKGPSKKKKKNKKSKDL